MYLEKSRTGALRALLEQRDLRLLIGAGLVSQTGDWLLSTGIAYEVYAATGSATVSAGALLATQLPQVVLAPIAGVVADRVDRRRLMVLVNVLLSVVLLPLLLVHGAGQLGVVFAVLVVASGLEPFSTAAEVALLPALVPRADLIPANALNGQARAVARLAGAAAGGVLVAIGGFGLIALVDAATFCVTAAMIATIRHTGRLLATEQRMPAAVPPSALGLVRRSGPLRVVLAFFALVGIGESAMGSLFAPFVRTVLHAPAAVYGGILSVQSIGGIAGGLLLTTLGRRTSPRALLGWGALLFGAIDLAMFWAPSVLPGPAPAFVLITIVGLPGAAVTAGLMTLFQLATPDAALGRIFGLANSVQNATMLAGAAVAGILADRLGIVPLISVQGAVYLAGGLVVLLALRGTATEAAPSFGSDIARPAG